MPPRRLELVVPARLSGVKVDLLLRRCLRLSGTVIRRVKWLEDGILLDGKRVHTGAIVSQGQRLSVLVGDTQIKSGLLPVRGALDIRWEDEDLLVLNKAPGVSVHPSPGHYADTLGNYLLDYYRQEGLLADFHPIHRLDKGTSGLMAVAKHAHAQERMKGQLHTLDFRRCYLAVCQGVPSPCCGVIDAPIGPVPGSLMAKEVRPDGLPARTRYEVLGACSGRALLCLELETGRTHQIRVHMAHLGHPLVGDFLYGQEEPGLISRPALHSAFLSFLHPITGERLTFTQPLPADIRALLSPPASDPR